MISSGRLTPQRHWHRPKVTNLTSLSFATKLTAHDSQFELTVRILSSRIKGQDLAPYETNVPLPPPINRDGFHNLKEEKWEAKVEKKSSLPSFFFFPPFSATTLATSFAAPQPMLPPITTHRSSLQHYERCLPRFRQGKPSPLLFFFLLPPPLANHCMQNLHAMIA